MEPTTDTLEAPARERESTIDTDAPEVLIEDELLVEEISIDGMCGVY